VFLKSKYQRLFLALFIIFVLLVLYSAKTWMRDDLSFFEKTISTVLSPFEDFSSKIHRMVSSPFVTIEKNSSLKEQVEKITKENSILKLRIQVYESVIDENKRLREGQGLKLYDGFKLITCPVIGGNPSFMYDTLRIGCGSKHGVELKQGVISSYGVIGVVMRVFVDSSDILLMTDPNSNLDVISKRTKMRSVLSGNFGNSMLLKYTEGADSVALGDLFITSGLSGIFPPGLDVGRVMEYKNSLDGSALSLTLQTNYELRSLYEVWVLRRDELLWKDVLSEEVIQEPDYVEQDNPSELPEVKE